MDIKQQWTNQILSSLSQYFSSNPNKQGSFSWGDSLNVSFIHPGDASLSSPYNLYTLTQDFLIYIEDYKSDVIDHYFIDSCHSAYYRTPTSSATLSILHRHNYLEFICPLAGRLDFLIEGVHKRYYSGECCMINQNVRHVEEYSCNFTAFYIALTANFFESHGLLNSHTPGNKLVDFLQRNNGQSRQIDYLDFSPVPTHLTRPYEDVPQLLSCMLWELLYRIPGYEDILHGYFKRLLSYLISPSLYSCSNTRFESLPDRGLFEATITYIHDKKRRLTRSELATALHYNGDYISQVFHAHTGCTLAEYIRDICLKEASNLLLNSDLSISDIIQCLGFENRTAFYNHFKKKYGMTPQDYRHSK